MIYNYGNFLSLDDISKLSTKRVYLYLRKVKPYLARFNDDLSLCDHPWTVCENLYADEKACYDASRILVKGIYHILANRSDIDEVRTHFRDKGKTKSLKRKNGGHQKLIKSKKLKN
jgi:hypothetical protein